MRERIILAGAGGQGTMLLGKLLATAAMNSQFEVTYLPSYGSEVRGGTANCTVIISDEPIYSPMTDQVDSLVVMNGPSFDRFADGVRPGGLIVGDSSMIDAHVPTEGRHAVFLPATTTAGEMGSTRVANMIMLGAYLSLTDHVTAEQIVDALAKQLAGKHADLLPLNQQALTRGAELAAASRSATDH